MYRFYYQTAKDILVDKPSLEIQKDNTLMAQFTRQRMRIMELEGENNLMVNGLRNFHILGLCYYTPNKRTAVSACLLQGRTADRQV